MGSQSGRRTVTEPIRRLTAKNAARSSSRSTSDERAAKGNEKKRGAKDIGKNLAPKRKQICVLAGAAKARF